MVNGVGFGQKVDPRLLVAQAQRNKASLDTQVLINANKDYDKFEKSSLPDKTKMNVATAGSLVGVGVAVGGAKWLGDKNTVKELISGFKGKALTFIGGIKNNLRGKLGYDQLKAVKDLAVENGAKILKKVKELPGPLKFVAAAATGLVLANRIYNGGKADGEHKAVNSLGKAQVMTRMEAQFEKLS